MHIPPIPPTGGLRFDDSQDPLVQKFNQLWNDWFDHPTQKTAEKLLRFIHEHHKHFEKIAKQREHLIPHPKVPFDHSYEAATNMLKAWIDHGCDPQGTTGPSEFIADMAQWIN